MNLLEAAAAQFNSPTNAEAQLKRKVGEVVRAYRHSWDVYSELVQNAVDAINRRYRIYSEPSFYLYDEYRARYLDLETDLTYKGRIRITVNVAERTVEVEDNGVGIEPHNLVNFLLPDVGDKKIGHEYGFKGYGLTYAAFIAEDFHLVSRHAFTREAAHEVQLQGLFDWLTRADGAFPVGPIPASTPAASPLDEGFNTRIKIRLADDYTGRFSAVSSLDTAVELVSGPEKIEGFDHLLRTRTAIGNVEHLFGRAPLVQVDVHLDVIWPDGIKTQDIQYKYAHPKDYPAIAPFAHTLDEYVSRYPDAGFDKNFRALYHAVEATPVGTRGPIPCSFAVCAVSSTRLTDLAERLGLINDDETGIKYGVWLSINGMPTGIRIDDWDSKGSELKRYYVVADASLAMSGQLDPGRKGISRHYARLISNKALQIINQSRGRNAPESSSTFSTYATHHLDMGRGPQPGGLPDSSFQDAVGYARSEGESAAERSAAIMPKLHALSSLLYPPREEQEVIALFSELLQRKVIKGYHVVYLSSRKVYDAAFEYAIDSTAEHRAPNDPLGLGLTLVENLEARGKTRYVHSENYQGRTHGPELVVEFKRDVADYLKEFQNRSGVTTKEAHRTDLLVTWSRNIPPSIDSTSYSLTAMTNQRRIFHGTTHQLYLPREMPANIPCIVLGDVLERTSL